MDRVIYKGEKLDNQDLTKEDLTNAYLNGCSLIGAKLGNCTNATFIKCNLTNADFTKAITTGADFQDCTFEAVKLVSSTTAWQRVVGKTVLDVTGFMPYHNHEFFAYIIEQEALKLPKGKLQDMALEAVSDIRTRKDLCYEDFGKLWDLKWYPNEEFMNFLISTCKADPKVWEMFKSKFKGYCDKQYPKITEDKWQDSL